MTHRSQIVIRRSVALLVGAVLVVGCAVDDEDGQPPVSTATTVSPPDPSPADPPSTDPPSTDAPTDTTAAGESPSTVASSTEPVAELPPDAWPVGEPVRVGIVIRKGQPGQQIGVEPSGPPPLDHRQLLEHLIVDLNGRSGFAGREVVPIFAELDNSDQSPTVQVRLQAEVCSQLTEDNDVDLVVSFVDISLSFDCYAGRRVPFLQGGGISWGCCDSDGYARLADWQIPTTFMTLPTMAEALAEALERHGFLSERMGLFSVDQPALRSTAEQILIPEIERRGGRVSEQVFAPANVGDMVGAVDPTILRFKDGGVDRVLVWSPGGLMSLVVMNAAGAQSLGARFAISTLDDPVFVGNQADPDLLDGTVGLGFEPVLDLDPLRGAPESTARELQCWENQQVEIENRRRGQFPLRFCEAFALLERALADADNVPIDPAGVARLVRDLGTDHEPLLAMSARFTDTSPDGVGSYRLLAWDASCGCFGYVSDEIPIAD